MKVTEPRAYRASGIIRVAKSAVGTKCLWFPFQSHQPIYGRKNISLLTELTAFLEGLFYKHFAATRLTPTE